MDDFLSQLFLHIDGFLMLFYRISGYPLLDRAARYHAGRAVCGGHYRWHKRGESICPGLFFKLQSFPTGHQGRRPGRQPPSRHHPVSARRRADVEATRILRQ